jgi:SAM-dependent methyltransferase
MRKLKRSLLAHPLTRDMDLDDPNTTRLRKRIILEKVFLHRIYREWYQNIVARLPQGSGPVLEIGSGAGFLNEYLPQVITSDIFFCPWLRVLLDAQYLPFAEDSLRAVVMNNVLHHIQDVKSFLYEASRCVRCGGRLIMIEPWVSSWSRFVYRRLHHEPFDSETSSWKLETSGPLSSANSALPWIVFHRDQQRFRKDFPEWKILSIDYNMPFRYLLSGGVSLRSLMPAAAYPFWRSVERLLRPWMKSWAMFATIVLEKHP